MDIPDRKSSLDLVGAGGLVAFSLVLAFNQIAIKLTNAGIGPIFGAGLRSVLALAVLALWMRFRGVAMQDMRPMLWPGLLLGLLFSAEFVMLFLALDLTTVSRASILFYSMPVWLAVTANFVLPGERLSLRRLAGLVLAMAGVALALSDPASLSAGDLLGDALALGAALAWMGIALTVRLTRLKTQRAETQLVWQLAVSAVVLLALAPLFGPLLRDPDWTHWAGLGFQALFVASLGFLFWLTLMRIYPASDIASFSFLTPVLAVALGWALLDEPLGPTFVLALGLVAAGLVLITRR